LFFSLTLLSFNLAFAQWIAIFPAKHVALFAIFTFELGSLLCGMAPNMWVLILGRAISGMGGSGIYNSALMIMTEVRSLARHKECRIDTSCSQVTTLQERARIFGVFGIK
jgi:MFS family permease